LLKDYTYLCLLLRTFEHEMVYGFVRQLVDKNVLNYIANYSHVKTKTLWDKLETLYASKPGTN